MGKQLTSRGAIWFPIFLCLMIPVNSLRRASGVAYYNALCYKHTTLHTTALLGSLRRVFFCLGSSLNDLIPVSSSRRASPQTRMFQGG